MNSQQTNQSISGAAVELLPALALPRVLENLNGGKLSAVEADVVQALEPLPANMHSDESAVFEWTRELMRSSSVVVLPIQDVPSREAVPDMENDGVALPPLPYSRLWLEFTQNGYPVPYEFGSLLLIGFAVTGTCQGWTAAYAYQLADDLGSLYVNIKLLGADGRFVDDADGFGKILSDLTVFAVSLIDSQGASLEGVSYPRQHRRAFERRLHTPHPSVYRVVVRANDSASTSTGSSRKYSSRWMVRGHWRTCTSDVRVWVKAHVKGPPGGPWRGRPVYVMSPQ